ncbi:hypothetical protein J7337_005050 [Fusarium musae]|uniref:Uncharacterized protein n=1 Tax=Fusarium musae TaxID=1042133 RepID=A0A9P8DHQ3_9HYPO|nr:hypothetical protein J7337_005050 [Fusarium musae]KAG9502224.1 hypothetical protein J7337_005050 [Fusarium musae]
MPSGTCTKTNQGAEEWKCEHDIKLELIDDKGTPSTCRVTALAKAKEPKDLQRKLQDVGAILQGRFGRRG